MYSAVREEGHTMSRQTVFALVMLSSLPCCGGSVPTLSDSTDDLTGFEIAGQMKEARHGHFSALLQDGRVLIGGGAATDGPDSSTTYHKSAEIFDPDTGTSTPTGSISNPRMGDTGILLSDGRVVFASPLQHTRARTYPVEIFDPRTGKFTPIHFNPAFEKISRSMLLSDGKILSFGRSGVISTIDPETGEFEFKNRLAVPRSAYSSTPLRDGRVLITGGVNLEGSVVKISKIYDPSSNDFTETGGLIQERFRHLALLLQDGSVLIVGGRKGNPASSERVTGAERFDPTTKAFAEAGSPGSEQAWSGRVLQTGKVFLILRNGDVVLYDPENGTFHPTGDSIGRDYKLYTVTVLRDGRVLVIGGTRNGETMDQILAYSP